MTSFYQHLTWFVVLIISFIFFLLLAIHSTFMNQSIYLSFELFSLWNNPLSVSFYLDYVALWFSTIILMISSIIMIYSYFYMAPYSKSVYFLWMTNFFILSMLLVVNMSDLFFLMLGWDGLGLVSFFLIVYYQNQSSITSGLFTLLMNRLGDSFFLLTIMMCFYTYPSLFSFSSHLTGPLTLTLFMLTFMTKSAIFPFSPWLPLAMAAPTPISALVHSSTLVTSGLYLMIRFSYLLYSSYLLMKILLFVSIFTSFYAGMNAIYEKDLKKLIALSTLSHLGFIGLAFSVGLVNLAYFHMLTHALFKSLLFMTMGDIMTNLNHSQDIRYLSSGMSYTPMSCMIMYVSLLNLLGLPNVSGYFSKDLILEMLNYSDLSGWLILFVFLNLFFTYYYTYQLFYYSFQPNKLSPYQNFHPPLLIHTILMVFMGTLTLVFGWFFMSTIYSFTIYTPLPSISKWLPLAINLAVLLLMYINERLMSSTSQLVSYYFSNMMFLSSVTLTMSSNIYYNVSFLLVKSTELGLFNHYLNAHLSTTTLSLSHAIFNLAMKQPMRMILASLFMTSFLFLFILLNNMNYYAWLLLMKFLSWI